MGIINILSIIKFIFEKKNKMAGNKVIRLVSSGMLAICALLSDSSSNNLVSATFNTVGEGVVRIDLERKYIKHIDNL